MPTKMAFEGIHHLALTTARYDETEEFYVKGLGLPVSSSWDTKNGRAMMIDLGNQNYLEVFEKAEKEPSGERDKEGRKEAEAAPDKSAVIHFALRCESCDEAVEIARRAGAEIMSESHDFYVPSDPPFTCRIAFCRGPNGEEIEFYQK
jgi:glyoxylase I family protein